MSDQPTTSSDSTYDLVVIGGNAGGLSVAIAMQAAGVPRVRVVEETNHVAFAELVGENQLDVGYGESVRLIGLSGPDSDMVAVTTSRHTYLARAVVIAHRVIWPEWEQPAKAVPSERILIDRLPDVPVDEDVLVIGNRDRAIELTSALTTAGARVVLAAGGMSQAKLSATGRGALERLEKERKATILYRSVPEEVSDADGLPMAYFGDRRTPDLEFDYVVFASDRTPVPPADLGLTEAAAASGRVFYLGEVEFEVPWAPAGELGQRLAPLLPEVAGLGSATMAVGVGKAAVEELRERHYNAVITLFEPTHSDLWVLRVKPDHGETSHLPGQYASLGLGYWEPRVDDAVDANLEGSWEKLVRRSYSISSRMFDDHGYLTGDLDSDELEFYIVLVPPSDGNVPGLTPRLALKKPGDRIYLGPKVAGRYTLGPVTDPDSTVLFFSTGTGEAPHNAMVVELLRKAHRGPIISAVSVRKWVDLGYIEKHRKLEELYPNYHYLPMPTREPDVPKRYIQDLIANDVLSDQYGVDLDPASTNVFLCGNPAMIGLPEEKDGETIFPEVTGVVELLSKRGFTFDHRGHRGNVHYEEYW